MLSLNKTSGNAGTSEQVYKAGNTSVSTPAIPVDLAELELIDIMSSEELTFIPAPPIPNGTYRFRFGRSTGFGGMYLTAGRPNTQATAAALRPTPGKTQQVRTYTLLSWCLSFPHWRIVRCQIQRAHKIIRLDVGRSTDLVLPSAQAQSGHHHQYWNTPRIQDHRGQNSH